MLPARAFDHTENVGDGDHGILQSWHVVGCTWNRVSPLMEASLKLCLGVSLKGQAPKLIIVVDAKPPVEKNRHVVVSDDVGGGGSSSRNSRRSVRSWR